MWKEPLQRGLSAVGTATLVHGCMLVTDLDVRQCRGDSDCARLGAAYETYACVGQVCVPSACETASDCTRRAPDSDVRYACIDRACSAAECKTDEDCSAKSPTSTCNEGQCIDPWGCVGRAELPEAGTKISFSAQVLDFNSEGVPKGLKAYACRRADISCGMPLAGPFGPDEDGFVSFDIALQSVEGFDGYVRFEAEGALPLEYHFVAPRREDFVASGVFSMLTPGAIAQLSAFAGFVLEEDEATLINIDLLDCNDQPAAGLRLEPRSAPDARFYVSDSSYLPTLDAPQTEASGRGGLINVPPGFATIDVVHVASQSTLFSFRLPVHAGTLLLSVVRAREQIMLD